jgi:hypothetical protein
MTFKEFFQLLEPEEKKALAKKAKTSVETLRNLASGFRKAATGMPGTLGWRLHKADKRITNRMLRPDKYGE